MDSLPEDAGGGPAAVLSRFRADFHASVSARADELSELADAVLCAGGPARNLAGLSLAPGHRRGHGALYDAVNCGRIDIARLRRALAGLPLPRAADGRLMLAVDVSNWLRPGAATSPDRLFCHVHGRGKGQAQMIPGWPYSVVAALEPGRRDRRPGGPSSFPMPARRMRAAGLVCLGAGAGLIRADLGHVRGTGICCRSGGVIVTVRGSRPRAVPVLARYHQVLLAPAAFAGGHLVTGGTSPDRGNITNPLVSSLAGGTGLPRLEGSRLRATWLADCASLIGLATFMHAAGITCSQRLGDIIAALDPGDEAAAVQLPGASAR